MKGAVAFCLFAEAASMKGDVETFDGWRCE